jgi:hypothetical protein
VAIADKLPKDARKKAPLGLPSDSGDDSEYDSFDPSKFLPQEEVTAPDGDEETSDSSGSSAVRTGPKGMDSETEEEDDGIDDQLDKVHGLVRGNVDDPDTRRAIAALYGDDCPLLSGDPNDADWVAWGWHLWNNLGPGQQVAAHLMERNRMYRKGMQWISAIGFGPWREPMKGQDEARIVWNMIKPALDQRVEIIAEQRPGFLCEPEQLDTDSKKRSDAQQLALEYQWEQQNMRAISRENAHWSGTDGVTFGETYWDVNAGPWQKVPDYQDPDSEDEPKWSSPMPMGDPRTRNLRLEQVRVSTEATMTRKPWLWVVREKMPKAQAVRLFGKKVADETGSYSYNDNLQHIPAAQMGFLLPELDELMRQQDTVDRITVYAERSAYLPFAMQMTIVGDTLIVPPMPIPIGRVPLFVWRDGSTDPAFFPQAEMNGWINTQVLINALVSKLVQGIRKHAGINLLARENTISGETLVSGGMNIWGVKGGGPLQDIVREVGGTPVSTDVGNAIQQSVKFFEQLSGWNDTTRGSFSGQPSGRAILAMREQVERVFAPMVTAASEGMCEWAELTLAWMKWGYDLPRAIRVSGKSRPDLGRLIVQSQDFDDVAQVTINPETLMPMPRALRLAILEDLYDKQLIAPKDYLRRLPAAYTGSIDTPDEDQEARANRVAEAIKKTGDKLALPILWQDNEAIHQDVLDRELILDDDIPEPIRLAAHQRWVMLAEQAAMKQQGATEPPPGSPDLGAPPPQPPPPPGPPQGPPGTPQQGPPPQQPPPPGPPNAPQQTGMMGPQRFMGPGAAPVGPNSPIASQVSPIDETRAASEFEKRATIR